MTDDKPLLLSELLSSVRGELKSTFNTPIWIVAEIMELNQNRTGHCYLELIEKDKLSDKITAKTRATIWASAYSFLKSDFEFATGQTLHAGLKIMARVTVEMHEVYGFSLNIQDINAQYTLGDIARQRAEVIARLTADGVIDMNKLLPLPTVIQRIAVISSDTAAGWGDFCNQIKENRFGYTFQTELFQACMQGQGAAQSIIDALNLISTRLDDFDVVAILRGGGSKSDLSCFDEYELSFFAAQFPLPILTGIGHERDDSVLDMIACVRLKTPTALAAFVIERAAEFDANFTNLCDSAISGICRIIDSQVKHTDNISYRTTLALRNMLSFKQEQLSTIDIRAHNATHRFFDAQQLRINTLCSKTAIFPQQVIATASLHLAQIKQQLHLSFTAYLDAHTKHLEQLEQALDSADPANILRRGYAIVRSNGKVLKSVNEIADADSLQIQLADGYINCIATKKTD